MKAVAIALMLALTGCSFTKEDRVEIAEAVVEVVQIKAQKEVEAALVKEGIAPEEAKRVALIAVGKVAELVDKALDRWR